MIQLLLKFRHKITIGRGCTISGLTCTISSSIGRVGTESGLDDWSRIIGETFSRVF